MSSGAFSQQTTGTLPPSFRVPGTDDYREIKFLPQPDLDQLRVMDLLDQQNGHPYRMAQNIAAGFTMNNSGSWTELPDHSGRVWRLNITIPGAQALIVYYNEWYIPEGCELYLYNDNKKQVVGGFTSAFNTETGSFATEMIAGDKLTLEFFEPVGVAEEARISIEEIGYVYRGAGMLLPDIAEDKASGACEVDVNCAEGANWQDEKKGVCRIILKNGTSSYYCTGSLMNNTRQDCTPYILLADHCAFSTSYATSLNLTQWLFYFHYEATSCGGLYLTGQKIKYGCTLKAHDTYGSNETGSDFYLVQLTQSVSTLDNLFYNGWSRSTTASNSGVSIHHPDGDIQKISTYNATLSSVYIGAPGSHWGVTWAATANGHGVTEPGSSGSPLFNAAGLMIGTLTGGGSSCTALTSGDYYGKMSYHWISNGTTSDKQLKPWLDPLNTGVTTLNGSSSCTPSVIVEVHSLQELVYLYPNPVEDILHIAMGAYEMKNPVVRIYSRMGALVVEQTFPGAISGEVNINLTGQPSGMFFLSLSDGQVVINKKIVILH